MSGDLKDFKGPVAWMAQNPVAANLLMIVILATGIVGVFSIKQEVFPEFDLDTISISVAYPGASPEEVEQGIVLAIEEAVSGIDGVKRVTSTSTESMGMITVELLLGADEQLVLNDVSSAVDRITTFPEEAEQPVIALISTRREVINLVISGDQDVQTLHALAERARAELLAMEGITQVEIGGVPPLEISIEVPRETLEAQGLTLDQIAQQIQAASLELPGGGIETRTGEILVRVADRRLSGDDFEDIVIRGTAAGYSLRLGDIATVRDGYADTDQSSYFDGHPAVRVTVYRVGDETPSGVASLVREYADQLQEELPDTVTVSIVNDDSEVLTDRINLLVRNALQGFVLVLIILTLFLRGRLAGWVAAGIPISFLGAFALLSAFGVSINMITLFALIITTGMVVDDAIIVGENTYAKVEMGMPLLQASIMGAREMTVAVTFSILTTVAAFVPLFFVPGVMGKIFILIPTVVVSVLLFSWMESFFVLPAHLGHGRDRPESEEGPILRILNWLPRKASAGLEWFTERLYHPVVDVVIRWRYVTMATATAVLIATIALVASGVVPFSFFPQIEGDQVTVSARLPFGAPIERTQEVRATIERSAHAAFEEMGGEDKLLRSMLTRVGEGARSKMAARDSGSHLLTIEVTLTPSSKRTVTAAQIAGAWERATPPIDGVDALTFNHNFGPGAGAAVDVQLSHRDTAVLARASEELTRVLRGYSDLTNVENAWTAGKPRLDFQILPEARGLGLTSFEVARQIRSAFYGAEALREQRGRNEIKVMVRLPEAQRSSENDLDQFEIRTPAGGEVPLLQVARFARSTAPSEIKREAGQRIVNVKGELAPGVASSREVLASLNTKILPDLQARYPGLEAEMVGMQREEAEAFSSLGKFYLIALFVMFALLAIPFRSYFQPIIVMSAIPFGFVGAIAGHIIMGYSLSLMSMMGIIALSGVVVNSSLVLVDASNRYRAAGATPREAIVQACLRRLRPVMLTSLTTFFGLTPIILEPSTQARFMIPMALSLGFGVLFSTVISLLLVPSLYMIVEDIFGRVDVTEKSPKLPSTEAVEAV